jgi:hypothetical protein
MVIGCFTQAVHEGRLSVESRTEHVSTGMVCSTVDCIGQTFKANDLHNQIIDDQNNTHFLLLRQYKGNDNQYLGDTLQTAIAGSIIHELWCMSTSTLALTKKQLIVGAFLFSMRLCESFKVPGERRTKLMCMHNVCFFQGRHELPHSDPNVTRTETVTVLYEF